MSFFHNLLHTFSAKIKQKKFRVFPVIFLIKFKTVLLNYYIPTDLMRFPEDRKNIPIEFQRFPVTNQV